MPLNVQLPSYRMLKMMNGRFVTIRVASKIKLFT